MSLSIKKRLCNNLVAIYQQTREWSKAIQYASQLVKMGRKRMRSNIAHFWCELAMQEQAEGDSNRAILTLSVPYLKILSVLGRVFRWQVVLRK